MRTITFDELTDVEKKAIDLKGGDSHNQTDIDNFFKMAGTTRAKWKRLAF